MPDVIFDRQDQLDKIAPGLMQDQVLIAVYDGIGVPGLSALPARGGHSGSQGLPPPVGDVPRPIPVGASPTGPVLLSSPSTSVAAGRSAPPVPTTMSEATSPGAG
jgi:hypothetical protein